MAAEFASDLLKEIRTADRRQAHREGIHEQYAIMTSHSLKDVVLRMGMVVPPVLARKTHDGLPGKRVVRRLWACSEILSNRHRSGCGTCGVHAWQTSSATASRILASFAEPGWPLFMSVTSAHEMRMLMRAGTA